MLAAEIEKSMAAIFAWQEEGSNSANAMLGVLFVLRNRVDAGWNHGSWLENISDARTHHPGQSTVLRLPDVRDPSFTQIMQLVDSVYDGTRRDNLTGGALHWLRAGEIDTEIMGKPEKYPRTATITGTTFFGEV